MFIHKIFLDYGSHCHEVFNAVKRDYTYYDTIYQEKFRNNVIVECLSVDLYDHLLRLFHLISHVSLYFSLIIQMFLYFLNLIVHNHPTNRMKNLAYQTPIANKMAAHHSIIEYEALTWRNLKYFDHPSIKTFVIKG